MNNIMKTHAINKQSGSTLVIALVLLAVMTILGLSSMSNSNVQEKLAGHFESSTGALQNAETGITDAIEYIEANFSADQIDSLLSSSNNTLSSSYGSGTNISYTVNFIDNVDGDGDLTTDSDGIFLLEAIGELNNALRNIVVRINLTDGNLLNTFAILTEEPLTMSGRTRIDGSLNNIHSNGDITVGNTTGSTSELPADSGQVSANSGISGTDKIQGTYDISAPIETVPDIVPSDFKALADYTLKNDGTILDNATGLPPLDSSTFLPLSNADLGWKYESGGSGKWKSNSSSITEALYYSESNIHIDKSIGSSGTPWKGGFLVEGSVEISGQFHIDSSGNNDLMFLAADDIKLNGSGNATGKGLIGTQGQFNISGEVNIEGFLISKGDNDTNGFVSENKISGQVSVNHDNSGTPFAGGVPGVTKLSWQERI